MVNKCLEFCQALINQGQSIAFSLTIGSNFSFSLDARKDSSSLETRRKSSTLETRKATMIQEGEVKKKKLSPSQVRRNLKRKEDFHKKKSEQFERENCDLEVPMFKCAHCDNTFMSEIDLKIHMECSHKQEDPMLSYKCDQCENTFKSETDLKYHTETKNMKEDYLETIEQFDGSSDMKSADQEETHGSFKCNKCEKYLEDKQMLDLLYDTPPQSVYHPVAGVAKYYGKGTYTENPTDKTEETHVYQFKTGDLIGVKSSLTAKPVSFTSSRSRKDTKREDLLQEI
jgi:DNA-directed RNA polymerase subunit RPC12/RpoP